MYIYALFSAHYYNKTVSFIRLLIMIYILSDTIKHLRLPRLPAPGIKLPNFGRTAFIYSAILWHLTSPGHWAAFGSPWETISLLVLCAANIRRPGIYINYTDTVFSGYYIILHYITLHYITLYLFKIYDYILYISFYSRYLYFTNPFLSLWIHD